MLWVLKNNTIQAEIQLVQKPGVKEVGRFGFISVEPSLDEKSLQCWPGERPVSNRCRIVWVEVLGMD